MEAVAAAAEVGKGTVFRRFGDRTGLLMALLDHTEKRFQAAFITGPAPLGPGAAARGAAARLRPRRAAPTSDQLDLYLAAEPDAARRFTVRAVPGAAAPTSRCCCARRRPDADVELLAHTLMGYLDPVARPAT